MDDYVARVGLQAREWWTIAELRARPKIDVTEQTPVLSFETHFVLVPATSALIWRNEKDHSIKLLLEDSVGLTIIAEIPNPNCKLAPYDAQSSFALAYQQLTRQLGSVTERRRKFNRPLVVEGLLHQSCDEHELGGSPNLLMISLVTQFIGDTGTLYRLIHNDD